VDEKAVNVEDGSQDDGLLSRLAGIEDQPLETRAPAYVQLHEELRERLEAEEVSQANPRSNIG